MLPYEYLFPDLISICDCSRVVDLCGFECPVILGLVDPQIFDTVLKPDVDKLVTIGPFIKLAVRVSRILN
jgi:hypothetical protein